jgi:hypothetical protein
MVENLSSAIELALKNSILGLLKWMFTGIVASSYWVCLFICMISMLFYISGNKKAGKYATSSLLAYIIIQALGGVFI